MIHSPIVQYIIEQWILWFLGAGIGVIGIIFFLWQTQRQKSKDGEPPSREEKFAWAGLIFSALFGGICIILINIAYHPPAFV